MRLLLVTSLLMVSLAVSAKETAKSAAAPAATEVAVTETAKAESAPVAVGAATENKDAVVENKKESEIPLNLNSPKKASEEGSPIFRLILIVSMMGVLGTGAYIYMRKYSKTSFAAGKNNEIKVLTQHYLGPKKSLAIIRVAGESILIGVTDQNINMIKSLALLDDEVPEEIHSGNFADTFANVPATKYTPSVKTAPDATVETEDEEEFSIRGVKDVVSKKLKGMRSFQ
ncbi:MAG: flagellar biosynthetic protein FliO [Bdellovibrionales bacterium]|nr:flagellar biosynthetic protein FliO [Bdellovibrionales bacterium]